MTLKQWMNYHCHKFRNIRKLLQTEAVTYLLTMPGSMFKTEIEFVVKCPIYCNTVKKR